MTTLTSVAEGVPSLASAYYVWQPAGKPLAVHLSLEVVDRMEREVLESFKAITQRGSEIGGVLLGRMPANQPLVVIEDYQPVTCDYARGPLYLLAEADKARLEEAVRRVNGGGPDGLVVVGFFRGNTRRELSLDEDDLALMSEHFAEARQVCLLVKPFSMKPSAGGFFIWEAGRINAVASYLQFPFKRSELTKGEYAKAIVGNGERAAAAPSLAPGGGNGTPAMKPQAFTPAPVAQPPAPAPRPPAAKPEPVAVKPAPAPAPPAVKPEAAAPAPAVRPAPPAAPRPEVRLSIPLSLPKREAPAAAPPPLPPVPAPKAAPRLSIPPVVSRREGPAPPPPLAVKPETRPPVAPVVVKREEPAPKPPARTSIMSLGLSREAPPAPKREEPAKPLVSSTPPAAAPAAPVAPAAKREEPAPPRPPAVAATPAPPEAPAQAAEPAEPAPAAEGQRRKLHYAIAAAVAVTLLAISGLMYLRSGGDQGTVTAAPDASSLALRVERNAGQLLLSWNREATLVKGASAAVLSIFDGGRKEDVKLDVGQLRTGSIVYSPMTNDVSFKLEVTDSKGQTSNETVRVIAGRPSPVAPLGQSAPARTESAAPAAPPAATEAAPQTQSPAADGAAEPSPTPGGGTEPPAAETPKTRAAVQFRTESLASRLSTPSNLPEPPALGTSSAAAPVRAAYNPGALPPPPGTAAPEAPAPAPAQPLRVGGNVQQALIVRQVTPTYPPLARQARVSGVVRVEATIGRDGRIVKVQALSGPPLLRQAAQDAVRQWVYKPTTLNGQAVEVVTQVDVTFNLNR